MRKYFEVFNNSLSLYFVYRINFILWRVRVVFSILLTFFLWNAVFQNSGSVFGYGQSQIITYILLLTFTNGFVLSTQTPQVADEIRMGFLSKYLIRPLNYFLFNIFRDLSDKLINLIFSLAELFLIYMVLKPPVFIQTNFYPLLFFCFLIIFASILYFEISLSISLLGFWIHDTWPTRFLFFILISFLAGNYFPLDILPKPVYEFISLLPFSYLIFFPLKVYLGQINGYLLIQGFTTVIIWIVLFYILNNWMWRKGLKIYTSEGQ